MWEDTIRKKIDYSLLKGIVLDKAKMKKGQTLNREEYLEFLEYLRNRYHEHRWGRRIGVDKIEYTITRILKRNNLLETKVVRKKDYMNNINEYQVYIFK